MSFANALPLLLVAVTLYISTNGLSFEDCEATGNQDEICQVPVCPDCRMVDCYPELTQEDCPEGTILKENLAFGGCCPACVTYMGPDDLCQPNSPYIDAETIFETVAPIPCTTYSGPGKDGLGLGAEDWGQDWAFRNESLVKSGDRWIPLISLFDCHPNYKCTAQGCTQWNTTDPKNYGCEKLWQNYRDWEDSAEVAQGKCTE